MIDLKAQKPAKRYAKALFDEVYNGNYELILNELDLFLNSCNIEQFGQFLFHPVISKNEKKQFINEVFKDFNPVTLNFLNILLDENRLSCLDEVITFFTQKINRANNIINAKVTLAIDADEQIKDIIKKRLEAKFMAVMNLDFIKDENILAGMQIKINDSVIDLSTAGKIEKFRSNIGK